MATLAASGSLTAAWNGTGVAPAGSVVQLTTADATSVGVEITGTFVATVVLEATMDGALWFAVNPFNIAGVGVSATITAPGRCTASVADFVQVRARCSAFTSGAAVVTLDGSAAAGGGSGGGSGGGAVTIVDGGSIALGAIADAAVQGDNPGTVSAKLRGLNKTLVTGIPITSLPALTTGAAVIGAVTQSGTWNVTVNTALPAGANSIGTVVLGAGSAAVGTVALTAGAAVVGAVTQSGTWNVTVNAALPAGANSIGTVVLGAGSAAVGTVALTAGAAVVGAVTQSGTWNVTVNTALPVGTNSIGAVTQGTQGAGGTASWNVQGAAAAGAAVAGNPVLVGGSDGTNAQAVKVDTSGRQIIVGAVAQGVNCASTNPLVLGAEDSAGLAQYVRANPTNADALTVGATGLYTLAHKLSYNGASMDRDRNNTTTVVQASTLTTAQTINTDIVNYNGRAFMAHANVTIYNGGSILMKLQWKDANGLFVDIPGATTGTVTSGADVILNVGPTVWPANTATMFNVNFFLPRNLRLVTVIATASVTYSQSYDLPAN